MRARIIRADMGEAVSFGDILSILTIIVTLRCLFFIPLINLDKVKLEKVVRDDFWQRTAAEFAVAGKRNLAQARAYQTAFDLQATLAVRTGENRSAGLGYIEALLPDSSLTVIEHNRRDNSFIALSCQDKGGIIVYHHGTLTFNQETGEWICFEQTADYSGNNLSKAMESRYRAWRAAQQQAKTGAAR